MDIYLRSETDRIRREVKVAVRLRDKCEVQGLLEDAERKGNINIQHVFKGALSEAVYSSLEIVSFLLDRAADMNAGVDCYGRALGVAAYAGKEKIVSLLLDRGADINAVDDHDGTALGAAASAGEEEIVLLLLDRGADINAAGGYYGTALGTAASKGNEEIVSLLLDRGADINTVDGEYGTALGVAAFTGKEKIVSLLLDRGADINTVGGDYGTALGAAAFTRKKKIFSLLLDRGADINAVGGHYGTALGAAAFTGYQWIVSLLLDRGADINAAGSKYGTALGAAASGGNKEIFLLLLDRGADINAVGGNYGTALAAAASGGGKEIVSFLLDRGADINAIGGKYGTALGVAAASGWNKELVSLLLDRGADINAVGGNYGTALGAAAFARKEKIVSSLFARGAEIDAVGAAASRENKEIVSLLLDRGADINAVGGNYGTALGAAAFTGKEEILSLLLDRGADINAVGGNYGTALGAAAFTGKEKILSLLLHRGADINAAGGYCGTALGAAASGRNKEIISLLLDRGADINAAGGYYGTALGIAASEGNKEIVSLLLDRGADINSVDGEYGTALGVAAFTGKDKIVSLLLDRGADINAVGGNYWTALGAAASRENKEIVSFLLDRGADINAVGGGYGTALGVAVTKGRWGFISLLLGRGADINAVGGNYGTALGAAAFTGEWGIVSLLLGLGADINAVGGNYGTALGAAAFTGYEWLVSLLLGRGADINTVGGDYGTALGVAAFHGKERIVSLLLDRGADINTVDGEYGTALGAAAFTGKEKILSLLLDRGADINTVGGKYGTALGVATYKGHESIVSLLLDRGAGATFAGGYYETVDGEYPTALHAAQSGHATPDLIALVEDALKNEFKDLGEASDVAHRPPFPMPHTPTHVESTAYQYQRQLRAAAIDAGLSSRTSADPHRLEFRVHAGDSITPEQADILCTELNTDILTRTLLTLTGIHTEVAERLQGWIQNDIRYFVSQGFDFGMAYAAARIGWKHFNQLAPAVAEGEISRQRGRWLTRAKEIDEARGRAIYTDGKKQELIESPYSVMPRRIWDLKSNRVVAYQMLHAVAPSNQHPTFWAVTHSWTACMEAVDTSINQYQWPVPLPSVAELKPLPSGAELKPLPNGADLQSVRAELLSFGAEYVWIDVLCLRQQSNNPLLEKVRQDEWKIDVPTIGNIYRAAERLVRYFNGLGRPFSMENWDDPRHWLQRAWTLQEIHAEHMTFNGGMSQNTQGVLLNTRGKVGGKLTTLRHALLPVLNLTKELHSPSGCSMYQLAREMARRHATQPTDKVAGLLYLLHLAKLPAYNAETSAELAWQQCFRILPLKQQIEILFDFPYPGTGQLLPAWEQIMGWPDRHPDYEHSVAPWTSNDQQLQTPASLEPIPLGIQESGGFYISPVLALSHVLIDALNNPGEYNVQSGNKSFPFYCPYLSQQQIETASEQYTLITLRLEQSFNWVVCKELRERKVHQRGEGSEEHIIQVKVLKKLGVLRTDSCSQILVWGIDKCGSLLTMINCLFV